MSTPWPSFWLHIPDRDRDALKESIAELLTTGVLLGEEGRARQLYLVAREFQKELTEFFGLLNLDLVGDPDRPILQARPIPGECGLMARFSKDETLMVLALWRMYDESRMERPSDVVLVTANQIFERLKLYFEQIEPPSEAHFERMISRLRSKRLIRFQRHEDPSRFGESTLEILPTLQRVIPFENRAAWESQVAVYRNEGGSDAATDAGSNLL
jgi:Domain of unknown function (DUF4194)